MHPRSISGFSASGSPTTGSPRDPLRRNFLTCTVADEHAGHQADVRVERSVAVRLFLEDLPLPKEFPPIGEDKQTRLITLANLCATLPLLGGLRQEVLQGNESNWYPATSGPPASTLRSATSMPGSR